jgi:hypothetical protein
MVGANRMRTDAVVRTGESKPGGRTLARVGYSTLSKMAVLVGLPALVLALGIGPASGAATQGYLSPTNTKIVGSNDGQSVGVFLVKFSGQRVQVNCTELALKFKTPKDGLVVTLTADPVFTNCTDTLGGTDSLTTSGKWKVKWLSEEWVNVDIPKGGLTVTSSKGCTATTATATSPRIPYEGSLNFFNQKPAKASGGCSSTIQLFAQVLLTPTPMFVS